MGEVGAKRVGNFDEQNFSFFYLEATLESLIS